MFLSLEIFDMEWGAGLGLNMVRGEIQTEGQALPDFSNTRRCFRETEINQL